MGLFDGLKAFLTGDIDAQQTVESADEKAQRAGWTLEQSEEGGYLLHGTACDSETDQEVPHTYQFTSSQVGDMNDLLDHVQSVKIGEAYQQEHFGDGEITVEQKHEIRDYRIERYYDEEYKPGWKRLLGL